MNNLKARLDTLSKNIETIDTFLIDSLSRLSTWLAPLVPAAMVFHAAQAHISDVGPVQALVAAAGIELLGLQVTSNWLTAGEYNRRAEQQPQRLAMRGYIAMLAAYVTTVLCIVVGLKVAPEAVSWIAIIMLSMLTLLSATAFVQRRQLSALVEHQDAMINAKHRTELRSARRNPARQTAPKTGQIEPTAAQNDIHGIGRANAGKAAKIEQRQEQMLELLRIDGPLTTGQLAGQLNLSPNTIRTYITECNGLIAGDGRTGWRLTTEH